MSNLLQLEFLAPFSEWGWPLVRLVMGVQSAAHGFRKATGGIKDFIPWLESLKVPAPKVAAVCAMLAELVGGLCIAVGLFTRPAGVAAAFTMAVAIVLAHLGDARNFGKPEAGAFEYPMLILAVAIAASLAGGGPVSLDALLAAAH